MEDESTVSGFSRWRSYLWPVHAHELKKLVPMLLIFFFISFNYNILRVMKDTLVVTAHASGPEAIPFIKVWVMFPGAILMTLLFTRFTNWFSRESVFYLMLSVFLIFFFVFTFFLYPIRDSLHPHQFADYLQLTLPEGCKGLIAMVRNWTFTLFYAMSELWGNIILFVLFWGFANQVIKLNEAKRFYAILGVGANFSGIVAGLVSALFSRHVFNPNLPFGAEAWEQTMIILVSLVLVSGLIAMGLFRWMHVGDAFEEETAKAEEETPRLSFRESFRYLMNSKYLLSIACIVIGYNVVINLVEVLWKDQVKALYPNSSDYSLYMNQVSTIIGLMATFASLVVSGNVVRKYGWTFTALLTPVILFGTSVIFFSSFFMKELWFGAATMLPLVVFAGSMQNVLSRGAKYTVFDVTKEMAFVPLGDECKLKGKAAIDGVCNRLGKSGGAAIQQVLLLWFGTLSACAPFITAILFVVIALWFISVRVLGRQFKEISEGELVEQQAV